MYALYKNTSLSISFSGVDGCIDKTQASVMHLYIVNPVRELLANV